LFGWIELDSQVANSRDSFLAFACGHLLHLLHFYSGFGVSLSLIIMSCWKVLCCDTFYKWELRYVLQLEKNCCFLASSTGDGRHVKRSTVANYILLLLLDDTKS